MSTDKEHYMAGDTIWLRALVADAATNAPVTASRYAYVELRDALGLTTDRVPRTKGGLQRIHPPAGNKG